MRKKGFLEELCWALSELEMVGQPGLNAFPCICGTNPTATDSSEVCEVTAKKILAFVKSLNKEEPAVPITVDVIVHADGSTTTSDPDMYDSEVWAPAPVNHCGSDCGDGCWKCKQCF